MPQLFLNNFQTQFIASVKSAPESSSPALELDYGVLRVSDGAAGLLLNPGAGNWYVLTAFKRSGSVESDYEVLRVTAVDNAVIGECRLTVLRGQEGTTPRSFIAGDVVELRLTAGGMGQYVQTTDARLSNPRAPTGAAGGVLSGTFPNPGFAQAMATVAELGGKVDKVAGKGLSANDYTNVDVAKLAGVAEQSTKNSTDAALRDRASHTGAQAIATVTGLQAALDAKAPSASPALTGTPTTPTAAAGTNTTQIASTAHVTAKIAASAAPIAHVGSGGAAHANATTAVDGFMSAADKTKLDGVTAGAQPNAVTSVSGRTGAVVLAKTDVDLGSVDNTADAAKPVSTFQQAALDLKANLASPAFTGVPTAPTAAATANTTQVATMAAVQAVNSSDTGSAATALTLKTPRTIALSGGATGTATSFDGGNNISIPVTGLNMGNATAGTLAVARGGTGTTTSTGTGANVQAVSPALTGTPTVPTAAASTNNTQAASTAFVQAGLASKQATLISGDNVKTIGGQSILGAGDIPIGNASTVGAAHIGFIKPADGVWLDPDAVYLKSAYPALSALLGTSFDGTVNSSAVTLSANARWETVVSGNGVTLAFPGAGGVSSKSTNGGATWVSKAIPSGAGALGSAYGNNKFIVIGGATSTTANTGWTSVDGGETWAAGTLPSKVWQSIYYADSKWVAIASDGTVAVSTDNGVAWATGTMPAAATWTGLRYGKGKWVAVATSGATSLIATSVNGLAWTSRTVPAGAGRLVKLEYGNEIFVAITGRGTGGGGLTISSDGESWSYLVYPDGGNAGAIGFGSGVFFIATTSSLALISADGRGWVSVQLVYPNLIRDMAFISDNFIVVGTLLGTAAETTQATRVKLFSYDSATQFYLPRPLTAYGAAKQWVKAS